MNISSVSEVIGVATKKDGTELRGTGKNGKPWVMYTVILENGTKLNVFGPVHIGDTVYDLIQDEKYHTWNGKVKAAGSTIVPSHDSSQPTNAQLMEAVRATYKLLVEVRKAQQGSQDEPYTQDTFNKDVILEDIDGEPVDISSLNIPF